jgi:DNA-binding NtrC family response regulator
MKIRKQQQMTEYKYLEYPILIVDDEENALESFEITLNSCGIENIVLCKDSREVRTLLKSGKFEIILLDLTMPYITGEELLPLIVQDYPETPVIIITGDIEVDTAVRCMQIGAFDYMVKPVEEKRLISGIKRGVDRNQLYRENMNLKHQFLYGKLAHPEVFSNIITRNSTMISILKYIEVIANSPEPVFLTGETGVGKELFARAIYHVSQRKGNFVPVNVAGLDDTIFSDTLFGHLKGAFTDAHQSRRGLIEQAAGGTLFLDEIGDLSHSSQVKLLRLIQEHEYSRSMNISRLALISPAILTLILLPPPTGILKNYWNPVNFEKTCTTGSMFIMCIFLPCAGTRMILFCWWIISWKKQQNAMRKRNPPHPGNFSFYWKIIHIQVI